MIIPHALVAKIHLAVFNIGHSMVAAENFFEQPAFVKDGMLETFDCVFGVPHMEAIPSQQAEKVRNDRYGRFPDLLIDRFSRKLVTLAHALKVLRPKLGRGAILLPQRFLNMMNTRKIRTYMASMNYVDAIAYLPSYLFPALSVDLAMLVFRMNKRTKKCFLLMQNGFAVRQTKALTRINSWISTPEERTPSIPWWWTIH